MEHSSGVRQSARINFDDDLAANGRRFQSKNAFLANTMERLEERFVEGHDGKSEGNCCSFFLFLFLIYTFLCLCIY